MPGASAPGMEKNTPRAENMTAIPLIHTTKGNLPLNDLEQRVVWTDSDLETVCASELWQGEECVRREVHILKRQGMQTLSNIGTV